MQSWCIFLLPSSIGCILFVFFSDLHHTPLLQNVEYVNHPYTRLDHITVKVGKLICHVENQDFQLHVKPYIYDKSNCKKVVVYAEEIKLIGGL